LKNQPQEAAVHAESIVETSVVAKKENPSKQLNLRVSTSLYRKIQGKAQQEGIPMEEFVKELISEGIVLRAWEIMEKKATMRGGHSPQGNGGGFSNNRNGGRQNAGKGRARGQGQKRNNNFNNIMEDSANFLEYVRNQERKKR
jgi:hypothetical protein